MISSVNTLVVFVQVARWTSVFHARARVSETAISAHGRNRLKTPPEVEP